MSSQRKRPREQIRKHFRNIYRRNREIIDRAKIRPCMDCGVQYNPWVMHFDHRDPSQKKFNVGKLVSTSGRQRIFDEMAKCDVVCANCHAERTHRQRKEGRLKCNLIGYRDDGYVQLEMGG